MVTIVGAAVLLFHRELGTVAWWRVVLLFQIDLPSLRLREHKALLLGQHFSLFDQLNAAVEGEHFHLLSAGLPGI